MTYRKELPSINSIKPQWNGHGKSRNKLDKFYLQLQKTHGNQTRQDTDLQWEPAILKEPFYKMCDIPSHKQLDGAVP